MQAQLFSWLNLILEVIHRNYRWMSWNLFLAFIPLLLSVWLFRHKRGRTWLWWSGLFVFIAFLPNAPYVLTDIIHLYTDVRIYPSDWLITLIVIPLYFLFILAGFEAYVLSLINLGSYLQRQGWGRWVLGAEMALHGLSAIGVYLGRFLRFNSWDLVTNLDSVFDSVINDLAAKRPLAVTVITFVVIAGLYSLLKELSLALMRHRQRDLHTSRRHQDVSLEDQG
jgi:uncharacterized membrane protein